MFGRRCSGYPVLPRPCFLAPQCSVCEHTLYPLAGSVKGNENGGHLFLGIKDNGEIVGVDITCIEQLKKDFVTSSNNPQQLNPPFYLSVEDVEIDGKIILYINIPASSQVHRCKGKIFDRNEDGDFDITNNTNLVSELYTRKQSTYTENQIILGILWMI